MLDQLINLICNAQIRKADMSNAEFSYEVVYVNDDNGCASFDSNDGDRLSVGEVGNGTASQ